MTKTILRHFPGRDGVRLACHQLGQGWPVMLVHGYLSNAKVSWLDSGIASRIAARGYRVIMPDLRGHGDSAKPHEAAAGGRLPRT